MTLAYDDFEQSHCGDEMIAEHDGYTVTIWRDDCAGNPWNSWDGFIPWFNVSSRNKMSFEYDHASDVTRHMPDSINWRQFRAILYDAARIDSNDFDSLMAAYRDLRQESLVDIAAELIANSVSLTDIETIETLYNILDVPCESFTSRFY